MVVVCFCYKYQLMTIQTHWGLVTHICVTNLTAIGSDDGLTPGRCHAIIWTNAGILLIGPLETNFSTILKKFYTFSLKKMHLKMSSGPGIMQSNIRAATIYSNIRFICENDLMIHIRYSPCLYSNTGECIFSRQLYGLKSSISLYNGPWHA